LSLIGKLQQYCPFKYSIHQNFEIEQSSLSSTPGETVDAHPSNNLAPAVFSFIEA